MMKYTYVQIPTYDPALEEEYDYARTHTLALHEEDGLRIHMGNPEDETTPDVVIERGVDLWRVFVRPDQGDELCIIEICADRATVYDKRGNSLLVKRLP